MKLHHDMKFTEEESKRTFTELLGHYEPDTQSIIKK